MSSSTSTLRIGIDFDDVISHTGKPLFEAIQERLETEFDFHNIQFYEWEEAFSITRGKLQEIFYEIGSRYSFHKGIPLTKGCKETMFLLKDKGHKLFVISARGTWELPYSTAWLKYHNILPLISAMIHKPDDGQPESRYKATIARELDLDVFIEDSPAYTQAIADEGIAVILFDAPYNRKVKFPDNVYRVKGWKDVAKLISKLEGHA